MSTWPRDVLIATLPNFTTFRHSQPNATHRSTESRPTATGQRRGLVAGAPVAVIVGTWLNIEMLALANLSNTTTQRFNERLRKIVKHKPVEMPEATKMF